MAKKKELRNWIVEFSITGKAVVLVEAASKEDAIDYAKSSMGEGELDSWDYDEVLGAELNE